MREACRSAFGAEPLAIPPGEFEAKAKRSPTIWPLFP
jgi:hypothetical protein